MKTKQLENVERLFYLSEQLKSTLRDISAIELKQDFTPVFDFHIVINGFTITEKDPLFDEIKNHTLTAYRKWADGYIKEIQEIATRLSNPIQETE